MNALGKTNSLPLDIIDRILCFLPDYSTLQATILSSKSFYRVFETHQNSILRAVSYNVTGPALPQAIRVLRYHDVTTQAHNSDPKPWSEGDPISPITNEEYEDEENFEDEDEDEEPDHVTVERELVARKTFLDNFVNYELFELRSAALFLIEVAKWVSVAEGNNPAYLVDSEEAVLTNGPKVIMKAYQDKSTTWLVIDIDSEAACKFLSGPLDRIWEQRKSKPPPSDSTHWTSLLDEVRGGQDTCKSIVFHSLDGPVNAFD
ncbi:hypothetical protein DXG01_008725 [Tephrocybe rancida]|nr:hypothetical protein DXG01_008725 [Tephrocybe rancida]